MRKQEFIDIFKKNKVVISFDLLDTLYEDIRKKEQKKWFGIKEDKVPDEYLDENYYYNGMVNINDFNFNNIPLMTKEMFIDAYNNAPFNNKKMIVYKMPENYLIELLRDNIVSAFDVPDELITKEFMYKVLELSRNIFFELLDKYSENTDANNLKTFLEECLNNGKLNIDDIKEYGYGDLFEKIDKDTIIEVIKYIPEDDIIDYLNDGQITLEDVPEDVLNDNIYDKLAKQVQSKYKPEEKNYEIFNITD